MSHCELHSGDDLLALRTHIGRIAIVCGVDISRQDAIARVLIGDFSECRAKGREAELLRALLVLLFRLESSVSEDLGVSGLRKLWREHDAFLAQHGFPIGSQAALAGAAA